MSSIGTKRLQREYMTIQKDPIPNVKTRPLEKDIFKWHFALLGPANTPYEGGVYHGKLDFPLDYPFRPPGVYVMTPNGRFERNARLCLSITDFHPENWNPAWTVSTILIGLLSFMVEEGQTLGSISTSTREKEILARDSLKFNLNDPVFCELFPDLINENVDP